MPGQGNQAPTLTPTMIMLIVLMGGGASGTATNFFTKQDTPVVEESYKKYAMEQEHNQMLETIHELEDRVHSLELQSMQNR